LKEEWNKLRGHWQYIWDKRAGKPNVPVPSQGRGQGWEAPALQARSIQALQQATSILSEIAGSFVPAPELAGEEVAADAGSSFGEVSYEEEVCRCIVSNNYPQEAMGDCTTCPRSIQVIEGQSMLQTAIGTRLMRAFWECVRWTTMEIPAALA